MLTAVLAGIAICFLDLFIWMWVGLTIGWVMANPPTVFALFLTASAIFLVVAYVVIDNWWVKRKYEMEDLESSKPYVPKKASFVAQVYRRVKDKTCFRPEVS